MCAPHVCLCCVTAFPRSCLPLSLFFSTCVPVLDGASTFLRSCLRLSPIVSPFVCLCWDGMTHCLPLSSLHMCLRWISEVLPPLVSHCLPTSAPVLDGVSAFPRSCLAWSSFLCPFVGWYARFPVLSPLVSYVSHCLQLSVIVSPHVSPPSRGLVSPCVPSCFPFVGWCVCRPLAVDYLPLSPFLFPFVGWCAFLRTCPPCPPACLPACLPACQVVFPSCSLWCPPSSLFPFLFPFLGWCARLPEALSPSLSPSWSLFLFPFVGWCVRLPPCLPRLPSFFPLLDGLSAFPSPCPVCLPACAPGVPVCLPSCFTLLEGASTFLRSCLFCLPACLPACFPACPPACLPACLSLVPQQKISHAENCADLKVHRAPGLKMMCHLSLSSFDVFNASNLTVLCCLLRAFGCTPIGCFLRRFSASSVATKQAKPNKINVHKVVCGTFCRYVH